ncbi:hypothetical protein Voja6_00047 [Pseudomonas phage vB_PpuM-Voja-6]
MKKEILDRILAQTSMFQHSQEMDRLNATIEHNDLKFLFNFKTKELQVVNADELATIFASRKHSWVVLHNFPEYLRLLRDNSKFETLWPVIKAILDSYPPPPHKS